MDKSKKSFEFRMSKKVAELTQVVHMLFTRNHEKEVEMEALKDAYEHEISLVMEDAKGKISILELQVAELLEKCNSRQKATSNHQAAIDEYESKIRTIESALKEEKTESQNLRDLLINAQGDIEKMREAVAEELSLKCDEIRKKDVELDQLKKHISALEKRFKDTDKEINSAMRESDKHKSRLQEELTRLHFALDESSKARDALVCKNKQLELDLKNAKKDFNKKVSEVVSSQVGRLSKSANHSESEELSRLRKEVQKYRLELSNRDRNFNRMFTEKQPVFIDARANTKLNLTANTRSPSVASSVTTETSITPTTNNFKQRERSFSHVITLQDDKKTFNSQRPNSAAILEELPSLQTPNIDKSRITRLLKPRPLPKELLITK